MRVLVKEGESVLADLSFEDEEVVVGSQPDCNIHLPDARVSPRNARVTPAGSGEWQIENLDPPNAILLNGHTLTEPAALHNGDEVLLHEYLLKVYLEAELEKHVVEDPRLSAEELAKIRQFPLPPGSVVKRHFDPVTLTAEQLGRVGGFCLDIANCRDLHELVDVCLNMLLRVFEARSAWIGIRRQPNGELEVLAGRYSSGQTCGTNSVIDLLRYRCVERMQHICIRKIRDHEEIGSAMAVPLNTPHGSLGMIYVDYRIHGRRFQIPDLDLLTTMGGQIAAKVDAAVEQRRQRSVEVSAAEVSVAHAIQAQLDPKSVPTWKNLQLAAYGRSGQERPGDVYDVMKHPDSELSAFMLGHVKATGASLALSMARLHSVFRVGFLHKDHPQALARSLNWLMYHESDPSLVDVVFLLIEPRSGRFKYTRAGRIGAFVVSARGQPRRLEGADGPSIGHVRNYEYVSKVEQLDPGETLVLYSRGVATATDSEGERFGEKRFIEMVCDSFGEPPATMIQDITHELTSFFADGRHADDVSIVLLRRTGD